MVQIYRQHSTSGSVSMSKSQATTSRYVHGTACACTRCMRTVSPFYTKFVEHNQPHTSLCFPRICKTFLNPEMENVSDLLVKNCKKCLKAPPAQYRSKLYSVNPLWRTTRGSIGEPSGNALASISTSSVGRSDTHSLEVGKGANLFLMSSF